MNVEGRGSRRLFATPEIEEPAGCSPDGRKILFTRYRPDAADVFVTNVDGTGARNLTCAPGFRHRRLLVARRLERPLHNRQTESAELPVIDADGTNLRSVSGNRLGRPDPIWR